MNSAEFEYTPDEAEAYARGYARAQRNRDRGERAAAFGAIRRAAAIARAYDRRADRAKLRAGAIGRTSHVYRESDAPFITAAKDHCGDDWRECIGASDGIRRAIRAAIGSDKA